jgi:hypothetical protein
VVIEHFFCSVVDHGADVGREAARRALAAAPAALALAVFLVRTTDWRKPSEADTPELDRASLFD